MSMIQITDLTFAYEDSYDNVFDHVSFRLDTDWKLGMTGRNGRGKTTLLRLLQGRYEYGGQITAKVDFSYFPYPVKDRENLTIDVMHQVVPKALDWQIRKELAGLDVGDDLLYQPFATLSYGERTKVLLAALFLRENGFPLIDEPTNHLDMEGRKKLAAYLNKKKGYILVSHDRGFLDACVDHIMAMNKTGIEIQKGNFSSWWDHKEQRDAWELAENEKLKTGDWEAEPGGPPYGGMVGSGRKREIPHS